MSNICNDSTGESTFLKLSCTHAVPYGKQLKYTAALNPFRV